MHKLKEYLKIFRNLNELNFSKNKIITLDDDIFKKLTNLEFSRLKTNQ
jgi:Leucine-rich repeat (LRR) protein